jgi:hypothetical protein
MKRFTDADSYPKTRRGRAGHSDLDDLPRIHACDLDLATLRQAGKVRELRIVLDMPCKRLVSIADQEEADGEERKPSEDE